MLSSSGGAQTGLARHGLRSFLPAEIQAPIIVTFHAPRVPHYQFKTFYDAVKARGRMECRVEGPDFPDADVSGAGKGKRRRANHGAQQDGPGEQFTIHNLQFTKRWELRTHGQLLFVNCEL